MTNLEFVLLFIKDYFEIRNFAICLILLRFKLFQTWLDLDSNIFIMGDSFVKPTQLFVNFKDLYVKLTYTIAVFTYILLKKFYRLLILWFLGILFLRAKFNYMVIVVFNCFVGLLNLFFKAWYFRTNILLNSSFSFCSLVSEISLDFINLFNFAFSLGLNLSVLVLQFLVFLFEEQFILLASGNILIIFLPKSYYLY